MDLMSLLITLVSGAAGGNIVGQLLKKISLGAAGNSIAGLIGGLAGPYIPVLGTILASVGGPLTGQIASGGVGGGALVAIIGLIRSMMNK